MSISLTPSRLRRIRRSNAAGIVWMVNNEHYWSESALRKILDRVQALCHEDTAEAIAAGKSALEIMRRRAVDPSPNLQALTLAIYATTLRAAGKLQEALTVYEDALEITGLGKVGKSDISRVWHRSAVRVVIWRQRRATWRSDELRAGRDAAVSCRPGKDIFQSAKLREGSTAIKRLDLKSLGSMISPSGSSV